MEWLIIVIVCLGCLPNRSVSNTSCPVGYYRDKNYYCQICPRGYYQSELDKLYCERCPHQMTTSAEGSTAVDDCILDYWKCVERNNSFTALAGKAHTPTTTDCLVVCALQGMLFAFLQSEECWCGHGSDLQFFISSPHDEVDCGLDMYPNSLAVYRTPTRFYRSFIDSFANATLTDYGINIEVINALVVQVRGCEDAQIKLYETESDTHYVANVIIGGNSNTISGIMTAGGYLKYLYIAGLLNCNMFITYWVSWNSPSINFGLEMNPGKKQISIHHDAVFTDINHVVLQSGKSGVCWNLEMDSVKTLIPDCPPSEINEVSTVLKDDVTTTSEDQKISTEVNTRKPALTIRQLTSNEFTTTSEGSQIITTAGTTTEPAPVTAHTTVTNNTTKRCPCDCKMMKLSTNYTKQELQQKLEELTKLLKVDVKATNAYERTKISAKDERPSATTIGYACGVSIMSSLLVALLVADAPNIMQMCRNIVNNVLNK